MKLIVSARAYAPLSTKEEPGQNHLAREACVQAPQNRYGQKHDMNIYNDAGYRAPEKPLILIEAVPCDLRTPAFAYGIALKDS